jgi:hypothetical protein
MTEELAGVGQRALGLSIDKHNEKQLLEEVGEEGEVREVARLASLGLPQAGAWLLTAPILAAAATGVSGSPGTTSCRTPSTTPLPPLSSAR